jgi:hypothetical protein
VTDTGGFLLTRALLERICCDATVRRIILDPNGVPLDVGRTQRTIPPGLRAAVVARDRMCTFPNCRRPPNWCRIHHITHWINHGPTELHNLVLVCSRHHDLAHHTDWDVRIGPAGHAEWREPYRFGERPWRTNHARVTRDPYAGTAADPPLTSTA